MLRNFLARFENVSGVLRPLWHDTSAFQGIISYDILMMANHPYGIYTRAVDGTIPDTQFPRNWSEMKRVRVPFRTSYGVLYTNLSLQAQVDAWYKAHAQLEGVARVIDFEVNGPDAINHKADILWDESEMIKSRDGFRPIIYTRATLMDAWLGSWTADMLNSHYYILAQYPFIATNEHGGPPTLPKRVTADRVIMQQTSGKKAPPVGSMQSKALDYDRWCLGDVNQMLAFIKEKWGGEPLPHHNWYTDIDAWARTFGFKTEFEPPM